MTSYQALPGMAQCDRIVAHLQQGPESADRMCAALGLLYSNLWRYIKRLRAEKRIHISGWEPRQGRPAPIYSAGDRPDVEFVPLRRPVPKISAAQRRVKIIELLTTKPRTSMKLAEAMHVGRDGVLRYLTEMRRERAVYVARWQHPNKTRGAGLGGRWSPVYAVGNKPDAPMPPKETSKQRHDRLSKDSAYVARCVRKRKARHTVERHLKKPQGIFAALGL